MTQMDVLELSREDIIEKLEKNAFHRLSGATAQDFARAWHQGRITDPGAVRDMISLLRLLPEDDPIFSQPVG